MPTPEIRGEIRFNRIVLGSWWITVAILGAFRLAHGDTIEAIMLLASASLVMLLGVALSIDRAHNAASEEPDAESIRLQKATTLFSVIAIATVIGYAIINRAIWWAALECAALIWIFPAVILPQIQAYIRRRAHRAAPPAGVA